MLDFPVAYTLDKKNSYNIFTKSVQNLILTAQAVPKIPKKFGTRKTKAGLKNRRIKIFYRFYCT